MFNGKHLIAGEWLESDRTYRSEPHEGLGREYGQGGETEVTTAANLAAEAFKTYSKSETSERTDLLNRIASELENNRSIILNTCREETGLVKERVEGEFTRTVNQLRYFGETIQKQDFLDLGRDIAQPDRTPIPKPELRMIQRPIGPVAVFGASNFPLAFSTAGGDTVAALAAGCPVVVKAHSAHPGTSECVAQCIDTALKKTRIHAGVFSQIQSNLHSAGHALVQHPLIKAVGFTGSTSGGRYLFNLCAARPEPIPFFGELGSINPVFVLPDALQNRTQNIVKEWIASLTVGAGQLCTNPGLLILIDSATTEDFISAAKNEVNTISDQVMLSDSIAHAYREGHDRIRDCADTVVIKQSNCQRRRVTPAIYQSRASDWLRNEFLSEEVFGPLGQVVVASSVGEMMSLADSLAGQLTCTIHMEASDNTVAKQLLDIVEHKAGRIIVNGFPTGVEVSDAMVHGGPYPASTNFGATSVGSLSIRRFLRPVCFQNVPDYLYPF